MLKPKLLKPENPSPCSDMDALNKAMDRCLFGLCFVLLRSLVACRFSKVSVLGF